MLRQRLVRQGALSSSDSPPLDTCRSNGLFRPLSSDSFDKLIELSPKIGGKSTERRRHSVAGGTTLLDIERVSLKTAFSSAVRRMSTACSYLVSSSQPSLSSYPPESMDSKGEQVMLPPVLDTFRCRKSGARNPRCANITFDSNRRFSNDFPPPSYQEVTSGWKMPGIVKQQKGDIQEISFKKTPSDSETPSDLHEVVAE